MLYLFLLGFLSGVLCSEPVYYDSYTGHVINKEEVVANIIRNTTFWCVNKILPCDPSEWKRVDGSCNNLKHPSRGAPHTPTIRLLPAFFDKYYEPRRSKSGKPLPLSRSVRTTVLAEGRVPNSRFTQLLTHFWVYIVVDFISVHDSVNYLQWTLYCCEKRGKKAYECIPNIIPDDDPVHRFSSIRCMNLTRPLTFQSVGCKRPKPGTLPERTESATPAFDLSHLYGTSMERLNEVRLFKSGMLKYEIENNKIWPPSVKTKENICILNQLPYETRCHDTPDDIANRILGGNIFVVWSWRYHNRIAFILSTLNPCWDDEKLFFTTRDIMIAILIQIYFYELMPALMGRENLIKDGVISPKQGFRDVYDENVLPQMSLEVFLVHRWAHMIQEGKLELYDKNGYYLKEDKLVNLSLRTGYLVDNLEGVTQGAFRQPAAKYDYIVDPDIAETILGPVQIAADVFTSDLSKSRYFGFAPYIYYRELCSGKTYKTFEDLLDVIDPERIALLKEKYEYVEDMDLMSGIWMERSMEGGYVPPTLYCVAAEQFRRSVISDRHWYERQYRPHAFTLEQLLEVRKASIAQFMCAVGDTVTEIQPNAFFLPGKGNKIRSCDTIQKIDLSPWRDLRCKVDHADYSNYKI